MCCSATIFCVCRLAPACAPAGASAPVAAPPDDVARYARLDGPASAEAPPRTGREALARSALGVLYEMGVELETDVRALLFFERFFVLYFGGLSRPEREALRAELSADADAHWTSVARALGDG